MMEIFLLIICGVLFLGLILCAGMAFCKSDAASLMGEAFTPGKINSDHPNS